MIAYIGIFTKVIGMMVISQKKYALDVRARTPSIDIPTTLNVGTIKLNPLREIKIDFANKKYQWVIYKKAQATTTTSDQKDSGNGAISLGKKWSIEIDWDAKDGKMFIKNQPQAQDSFLALF